MAQSATGTLVGTRNDVHNPSVNATLATAGYCGMTHLCSGRVCVRPARHDGSCAFRTAEEVLAALGLDVHEKP